MLPALLPPSFAPAAANPCFANERLLANAKTNEAQLERLSDDVNRFNLESAKLQKRVAANEEWVESINGFRKQVNRKLVELQGGASTQ